MARKKIRKILSGGAIVLCIALFCFVDINVQAFEAVKITYTISGSAGVSGVTMKGLPGPPVITDQSGYYSVTVDYGWKGTVTPYKEGYEFTPKNKVYDKVTGDMTNQDYTPTPITYTISGKVDMEGVEMNGLPGNPVTGTDGTYSATVEYGWQGVITPIKEGYSFKPDKKEYPPVKSDWPNQNFTSERKTLLISGSVGEEGVMMKGLPGNPVTGKDGIYSVSVEYGWSGTVTPTKEGYEFNPPEVPYTNVTENQPIQNYAATVLTYTISGTAGMAGVKMKGLPGDPITDQSGYYTANVDYGFNGTVEPTMDGYTFTPASKIYTKVNSDRLNENYTGTMITLTISGTTRMAGVVMNGLPGNPVTDKDGSYSVTVNYGWSDTVTPTKEGYKFTPASKPYVAVTKDMTNENYTASPITYTISGSTTVAGVTLKGLPGKTVISGQGGMYTATVDYGWKGTVTPLKDGYDFNPSNIPYDNVLGDQTNQSYTPTLQKRTISGQIFSQKGQPAADVYVLAEGAGSATTNAAGEYELTVDYGWLGKITPTREGYTFNPSIKPYSPVTTDQTRQNFTAIVRMFTITDSVIIGNTPIPGVMITAKSTEGTVEDTTTTDAKGLFKVSIPYGWTGEIIPTKEGLQFNPPSQTYTNVTSDMEGGKPVMMRAPTPPPTTTTPTTPAPTTPTTTTPAIPKPTTPAPTTTTTTTTTTTPPGIPTPPTPAPTTPTAPAGAEAPKTQLEKDISRIQGQLDKLLRKQAGETEAETAPGPGGITAGAGQVPITNSFIDNDLPTEVLPAIASQAGISIIPDGSVTGMVTASLQDVPLDTALDIVLAGTPYVVKKTPYYYLVCSGDIKENPMFPQVSETRRLRMNYISAEAAVGLLATPFKEYAQAEVSPTTGTSTYTVVVTAPPKLADRIVEDLKKIDRPLAQILLDARVVVMEKGDLLNLGVEWGWPKITAGMFSSDHYGRGDPQLDFGGESPWGIQIGYTPDALFTNALDLTLNLLATNNEATILTKPQVMALDGKESKIEVTTEEYYMLVAPELTNTFYARTELQEIKSGTILTITPHLGDNNDITLNVAVEVSDSIPRGAGSDLPVVTRRKAENNVTIKDGGTVALAGLKENKTRKELRRTPGLSQIPLIGSLFKNNNNQNLSREIAVFVTAHLVKNTGQATQFTEPADMPAPNQPVGDDFKSRLRESLLRK
jgi:hypothetical protein